MPYIPYGRQDRSCYRGEAFSLNVFAKIINSYEFDNVHTMLPHSSKSLELIDNINQSMLNTEWDRFVIDMTKMYEDIVLIQPDRGASERIDIIGHILKPKEVIRFDKNRDPNTGNIIGMEYASIFGKPDVRGKVCLIYDDICDGGRTFIEIAKILREDAPYQIILATPHGIFSKGFGVFDHLIDMIITTNTFGPFENDSHTVVVEALDVAI